MIIANGKVQFLTKISGGGIDSLTGYATDAVYGVCDCIPCQYYHNTRNDLNKEQGEPVTKVRYTILIENPCRKFVPTEKLILLDRCGRTVGEFSVVSWEPLDAVCQIRIFV